MAFDGICVAAIVKQLNETLLNGRLYKIAQPEKDELLITVKNDGQTYRLLMSADASLPLLYLTEDNKKSPMTAPNFCMLLRKHIQNGRIVKISQPGLERVVTFEIEHLDEMGDLRHKTLAMELMGKHSNIIFYDEKKMILDSIKHISGAVSSVREVLPGREYFIPQTMDKISPILSADDTANEIVSDDHVKALYDESGIVNREEFLGRITQKAMPVFKTIYTCFTGVSPVVGQEICFRAKLDADMPVQELKDDELERLYGCFYLYFMSLKNQEFQSFIVYENEMPTEFGVLPFTIYENMQTEETDSVSDLLYQFYSKKSVTTRIRQKSVDLRKIVTTHLERNIKKYDLQQKQLKDTEKRDKYKVYGELLHTYGYQATEGDKQIEVDNYYTGEKLLIPLDPEKTAMENAASYFDKYGKLKRTFEALTELVEETKSEIDHLESVLNALDFAQDEEDLKQIRLELEQSGYIKYKGGKKKEKILSKPLHYISSDGFHMYVGKNNFQNEEITFGMAKGNDWWFHAKGMPGSHVIVKTEGKELPDTTFEEAGRLAAFYSKAKGRDKVEIDYIEKKHVKKPGGGKPGFVVYYTNYSLLIDADISKIKKIED